MPSNPESLLISSIVLNQDLNTAFSGGVSSSMFHAYSEEFAWLENYYKKYKKTPSKIAFKNRFPEFNIKKVSDTGHFSELVRKSHARYCLTTTMREVADKLGEGDIDTAIQKMHSSIITIASGMGEGSDADIINSFDDILKDVSRRVKRVEEKGAAGIPTGFPTYDERTGGQMPGHLTIVGARLGEMKSWTLQSWATASVMAGYTVQFDALEMSKVEVAMRVHTLLSSDTGKNLFKNLDLAQGRNFSLGDYKKFVKGLKERIKGSLHVCDATRGKVSPLTVASQIERNNPDVVYIDYITLMEKGGTDWQNVAQLSGELKVLATEYQVPIVCAAQLNRTSGIGKGPAGPEAIAQADAIGQDADEVVTQKLQSPSVLVQYMAKNRHGKSGFKWYVDARPSLGRFKECTHSEALKIQDTDADEADAS